MPFADLILADGFPKPLIIAAVFVILWVLSNVMGKGSVKPTMQTRKPPVDARTLQSIRQRMTGDADLAAARVTAKAKQKLKRAKQRATDAVSGSLDVPPVASRLPQIAKPSPAPPVAPVATSRAHSEPARNVRLLLQRKGIRESFLVAEILGRPKSMD